MPACDACGQPALPTGLNAQANLAPKGLKQSAGLMVNYLYDLARIETSHDRFVEGRVVHSRALSALL